MTTITVEQLQTRLRLALQLLYHIALAYHYALRDSGSMYHRGPFENCADPDCREVLVMLGREGIGHD